MDGWDIGHVRRVRWLWANVTEPKIFKPFTFKQGDTTQLLSKIDFSHKMPVVYDWLDNLNISEAKFCRPLVSFPNKCDNEIKIEEIYDFLFENGVASASISNLINDIGEFIRIANWCRKNGGLSEQETLNHLVVPLLRSIGWTPQKMAIEWNKIDVALFSRLPREQKFLSAVIEAKKLDKSCLSAFDQAESYAIKSRHCGRIIVTDGMRYGAFVRDAHESSKGSFTLYAYMNLLRLRRNYPLYTNCKGAQDAILAMSPNFRMVSM